jgi:AcrR family transcriptional regulator
MSDSNASAGAQREHPPASAGGLRETTPASAGGLRERKRASAQAAIERIALALALRNGYENTTVEQICESGLISQRTFFNYFGSKEGVFLGAAPPAPSSDAVDRFLRSESDSILSDLVVLITSVVIDRELDRELWKSRRELIMSTPELSKAMMARMADAEEQFVALVLSRFEADQRPGSASEKNDEARMLISLATGVMHFTMRRWSESQFATAPSEVVQSSISLLRRVIDRPQS